MATPTYTLIDSTVLSSSASSVTFSSITQDYRDLVLIIEEKSTAGGVTLSIRFNGDSGANYPWVWMQGDGSSASSTTGSGPFIGYTGFSGTPALHIAQIMDYSATDKHKTFLSRQNIAGGRVNALAGRWSNTSAISSVEIAASTLASGSTFYLFGIEA